MLLVDCCFSVLPVACCLVFAVVFFFGSSFLLLACCLLLVLLLLASLPDKVRALLLVACSISQGMLCFVDVMSPFVYVWFGFEQCMRYWCLLLIVC